VPMFQVAGRAFAMDSAPDHVRAAATDVLEPGMGIAEAIRRAF
jgi:hydroxymethylpyrimidine pyrophosphatase-like HAD family hydrolase